jgi:hypothetical protein
MLGPTIESTEGLGRATEASIVSAGIDITTTCWWTSAAVTKTSQVNQVWPSVE